MTTFAVIKTGGKQYLVKENDVISVDRLAGKENDSVELETLAVFDDKGSIKLGKPGLETKTSANIVKNLKGEKIRVSKFKSKVRYRRTTGFRSYLTELKITKI